MASRLSGRAKTVADDICQHTKSRLPQYPSARKQRKHLAQLITELAGFPITIERMIGNVPAWVIDAVKTRRNNHLSSMAGLTT
ncbi:MAG TPA: hypothetical protein VJM32_06280 [Candidatus Saccharimonadales bacterium]|nr:hypothetical protein [Candidatus Saccharimonadales bacterium]